MAKAYDKGDLVTITAEFKDAAGVLVDPTTVTFKWRVGSSGTARTYTYGTDEQLERSGEGKYSVDLSLDTPGTWHYRWASTGTGQAATENVFQVRPSEVD